ncbi:hypothetical protein EWM64_g10777 [Hericium alpestre]|uniref:Uncharacterized protein n=1 Tax=Hericium alpestre TaxID=135208 RepID=A0A4Y9ZEN7_9AGAM|nr:hypothetical protein EWM64_g10777 [Hericium alpestre]
MLITKYNLTHNPVNHNTDRPLQYLYPLDVGLLHIFVGVMLKNRSNSIGSTLMVASIDPTTAKCSSAISVHRFASVPPCAHLMPTDRHTMS